MPISLDSVDAQEAHFAASFAASFAAGDISLARPLYHPDVVYSSPTTRLFGWPRRVDGVERALEFIQLTISGCRDIAYRCVERAILPDDGGAYTRIRFDWDADGTRLRSTYVVVYRYADDGRIIGQELYYDPSDELERLG